MTELQIKAAQLAEDRRHNLKTEQLTGDLNKAQAKHLETSDVYTAEHYVRSDRAGMVSANANAMNAETNRLNYGMQHDIEYGWTGDYGYPSGMPLSAQKKTAEIAQIVGEGTPAAETQQKQRELELEATRAKTELSKAQALNQKITGATSILNSVFGKGGVVQTVDHVATSIVDLNE